MVVFSLLFKRFLLGEEMEYILTERFCQDTLEEYFGNQLKLGRRSDNPDIRFIGYKDHAIRIQRLISCQSSNTRGKAWVNVTDDPVPRKKSKEN